MLKLEPCLGDTDGPAVAKYTYSHKQRQKRQFMNKGQLPWKPPDDMDHLET